MAMLKTKRFITVLMAAIIAMTSIGNAGYVKNDPINLVDPNGQESNPLYGMNARGEPNAAARGCPNCGAQVAGVVADFTPIVGDIKGISEAIQNPTVPNIVGAAIGIVPIVGDVGKGALKSFTNITDHGDGLIEATFDVSGGSATVLGEVSMDGTSMLIDGAHIQGDATLKEALGAAKEFGAAHGATEVTIQGAARTTGANPGHTPKPITVKIDEPQ